MYLHCGAAHPLVVNIERCVNVQVGDETYPIVVNAPTIEKLQLKGKPMVEHPVVPLLKVEHADTSKCQYHWLRRTGDGWEPIVGAESVTYEPTYAASELFTLHFFDLISTSLCRCPATLADTPLRETPFLRASDIGCPLSNMNPRFFWPATLDALFPIYETSFS